MARTTSSALASWEYPKKSGIRIREVLNLNGGDVFGASYLVTLPVKVTGKGRERKQFENHPDAEQWAERSFQGYRMEGGFFALTDAERREVAARVPLLREHGISISTVSAAGTDLTQNFLTNSSRTLATLTIGSAANSTAANTIHVSILGFKAKAQGADMLK